MTNRRQLATAIGVTLLGGAALPAHQLPYQAARTISHVDVYHGAKGPGPLSLARRRQRGRHGRLDRGGAQAHVRVPREDTNPSAPMAR